MTAPVSWLIDRLSAMLAPDECEAVRGDFEECRITGAEALRDLLGLIVRRQAYVWADWHPWAALVGLIVPIGMILSVVSRHWAASGAIYGWMYVNNWTWGYVATPGATLDLAHIAGTFSAYYVALALWAWTTGYAIGSLAPRAAWINGALFVAVLFGGTPTTVGLQNPANAAVFSLAFYRVVFPALVRAILIVLPVLWGMRTAARLTILTMRQAAVWALIVVVLTALTARGVEVGIIFGWVPRWARWTAAGDLAAWRNSRALDMFPLAMMWPAAFILGRAVIARHRVPQGREYWRSS